jgi:hypothetical protein
MMISITHDDAMSTPAAMRLSRKRLRPGKVSAKTSRHSVSSARVTGSSRYQLAARKVSTVIAGSRNAATSDVTDWGAL